MCNDITYRWGEMVSKIDKKKTETIQIRMTKEQKEILESLCRLKGLNKTEMILYSLMKVINEE